MFKLIIRIWHYTAAFLTHLLEEKADPRIQIEQALEDGKQQHLHLVDAAAAVTAGRLDLEAKITRASRELAQFDTRAGEALRLAAEAAAKGDSTKASGYERLAESFAIEIAARRSSIAELRELHARAAIASNAAQRMVEQNKFQLKQQMTQRIRVLNDLAAAEMQQRLVEAIKRMDQLAPASGVPTFAQMEEKVATQLAHSSARLEAATSELDSGVIQVEMAVRDRRGAEILDDIRKREGLPATTKP